jgi:hypothetical protein
VRRALLVFLLATVLPLRALAGDFMVLAMSTAPSPALPAQAMAADCAFHLGTAVGAEIPSPDVDSGQCATCSLCLPVVQLPPGVALQIPELPTSRPLPTETPFSSASPSPTRKPPKA